MLPYVTGGPLAGIVEIRTAGHCRNLTMSYDGATLSFGGAVEGGSQDVQWHIASGFTVRNWVWDGTNLRFVTSTKHRNQQAINEWVCKFGIITGYGCGYIIDKNYTKQANSCDNHPCSHYPTWIRVHRDGVDLSTHGDSGGPWFVSNTAYGTMSASLTPEDGQGNEIGPSDALYMAINYLSSAGLGITVLTE